MSEFTLEMIAEKVGGQLQGDPQLLIRRLVEPEEAGEGDLSVVFDLRNAAKWKNSRVSALIVPLDVRESAANLIRVSDPRQALILALRLFFPTALPLSGIDRRAIVESDAQLGVDVYAGPGSYVGSSASIGARCVIHPNSYIGARAILGDDCEIFPQVSLYPGTILGNRVRVHSGTVIGSDGFGYARDASGNYRKIPQVGRVEIGDDVEIGANCAIDRATLGVTRIQAGTKIDNLVQIGHNSNIGSRCCIISQVGISGSVTIGDQSVLAGQAGISDHVKLAPGAVVGAQSGVKNHLGPGEWLGTPAIPADRARRVYFVWERLPQFRKEFLELQKYCATLEERLRVLEEKSAMGC
jgi:UDP-3-O-[3-hydroxymyristoyl] glucosamine N-acyltransferase